MENPRKKDVVVLEESSPQEGKNGYSTPTTLEMLRRMKPIVHADDKRRQQCSATYLIRTESRYVLNYVTLLDILASLPRYGTYFGTIATEFPSSDFERVMGSYSQTLLPRFAFGGFYGFSRDVFDALIQPTTVRTINYEID
eukprot:CAMPEP_0116855124 /NCGR_PEP_ID=MMETSP0418-20121206/19066_1 /TAXON_ID=1158023 /ORGANISM="Astrosyne radiata, Strain 13vi08-1A" /LENGTH=140 /DNA_ID=CAMNT_0004488147 /DNA_START=1 /DNA_END=420 /DNA_ORIENTATION=-